MRILIMTPFYPPPEKGGIAIYAEQLSLVLATRGIDVTVMCIPFSVDVIPEINLLSCHQNHAVYSFSLAPDSDNTVGKTGFYSHQLRWSKILCQTFEIFDQWFETQEPFSAIHVNDYFSSMYLDYFLSFKRLPVISTMHATSRTEHPLADSLRRYTVLNSQKTIAVSHYLKNKITVRYGLSDDRHQIQVIHCGVSQNVLDRKSQKVKFHERPLDLLYCGRLTKLKGADFAIRLIHRLAKRGVRSNLAIIGEGPEENKLKEMVRVSGLNDRVQFYGSLPNKEVRRLMSLSKIHLIASEDETFGLTALEAMAEGAVVVSSKVGGLKEFIADGFNGYFYDHGVLDQAADRVAFCLANPDAMKPIQDAGIATAEKMSWLNVADETISCYEEALRQFDPQKVQIMGFGI